jgi:hypothetical protein
VMDQRPAVLFYPPANRVFRRLVEEVGAVEKLPAGAGDADRNARKHGPDQRGSCPGWNSRRSTRRDTPKPNGAGGSSCWSTSVNRSINTVDLVTAANRCGRRGEDQRPVPAFVGRNSRTILAAETAACARMPASTGGWKKTCYQLRAVPYCPPRRARPRGTPNNITSACPDRRTRGSPPCTDRFC